MDPPVVDLRQARQQRDTGIALGETGSSAAFQAAADAALQRVLRETETFIVDDVWQAMGDDIPLTRDRRAMGGVIVRAVSAGLIRPTETYRPSAQRQCHANPRRVWTRAVTSTE